MFVDSLFLIIAALAAIATAMTVIPGRRLHGFILPYFLTGWLVGELALFHIAVQALLCYLLVTLSGLGSGISQLAFVLLVLSIAGLAYAQWQASLSRDELNSALHNALGQDFREQIPEAQRQELRQRPVLEEWIRPFAYEREGVIHSSNIPYGEAGKRNLLDIYQPEDPRPGGSPVLLQVHGGAWIVGHKRQQALPLMYHMAQRGWICVAINYRLSPRATFPDHIIDVKKAIAWIRRNIADFGGNPDFIAITGGSAGGHLSSLAALSPNDPELQPGFEEVDTRLQSAVPFYGVYDFTDRHGIQGNMSIDRFASKPIFKCRPEQNPELWDRMSSESRVNADAPPFFIIQGSHDSLVWAESARAFRDSLARASTNAVAYAELTGAQHAFDVFHSLRTDNTVNSVCDFLEWSLAQWQTQQPYSNEQQS